MSKHLFLIAHYCGGLSPCTLNVIQHKYIKEPVLYISHFALFIQQVQDTKPSLDQVNAGLVVVVLYHGPGDLLLHILFLLQLKHMLVRENKEIFSTSFLKSRKSTAQVECC